MWQPPVAPFSKVCKNVFPLKTSPVLDRFQDSSKTGSDRFRNKLFAAFLAAFLLPFFCLLFSTFLSTQYKYRAILSMQYKSLLHVIGDGGGGG